ncbi:MAG: nucleoside hydrolase [Bacillota bacterium]
MRNFTGWVVVCLSIMSAWVWGEGTGKVPVIHCTDLYHPHDDPDDHFDLATISAIPELEVKAVILDQGGKQKGNPGEIPVRQMNKITGREVPWAIGLSRNLKTPGDQVLEDAAEFQKGVELILKTLRESPTPVVIDCIGSMRDVAAAFNREPALFRSKVAKLMIFIGEASEQHQDYREWNVRLDPQAYVAIMRSGLPIYWVPCMDGGDLKNEGGASFWVARHADLLKGCSPRLMQYFIYALEVNRQAPLALGEPIEFLDRPIDPAREQRVLAGSRNLWCTAVFTALADQAIVREGERWVYRPMKELGGEKPIFGFRPVNVEVSDTAAIKYGAGHRIMRFEVYDRKNYAEAMTAVTRELLLKLGRSGAAD